ncbi:MAG: AtpZ/AtpI family protein [Gammaproteobacteria bacterium]|nr:AtpZ/AtpI family protein [Gammaproteobacteria bacterium]
MQNIDNESNQKLQEKMRKSIKKLDAEKKDRQTIFAQTIYLGTIGIIFILPIITGAYLGVWLDNKLHGYSVSWTISLIFLGIIIGAVNIYLFIRE